MRQSLYSYAALQSRLAENAFAAQAGIQDFSGPVLRLAGLTHEDFYVLLAKLRHVYASGNPAKYLIPDEGLMAFMEHAAKRLGDAYFKTPRTTIVSFLNLLATLEQGGRTDWRSLLNVVNVAEDRGGDADRATEPEDDELTSLKL